MISIVTNNTADALKEHSLGLTKKVTKLIDSSKLPKYLKIFLLSNLNDILTGTPEIIEPIQGAFEKTIKGKKENYTSKIKKIFSYANFITKKYEYNAYELASNLKINCCPYCNRQYTITVSAKKIEGQLTRPELDHYFSQSKYPLLGISFYNLIPSCKICNSTFKGKKEFKLKTHLHPYIDNIINEFEFYYEPKSISKVTHWKNGVQIKIRNFAKGKTKKRIEKNLNLFKISEVYNAHSNIVTDILTLKESINGDYLEILANNTYTGLNTTPSELYSLAFGNYLDPKDFNKKPFSKLTKDILIKETMLEALAKCTK